MPTKTTAKSKQNDKKKSKKKGSLIPVFITAGVLVAVVAGSTVTYFVGRNTYKNEFTPHTYINGVDVSGKTLSETKEMFAQTALPQSLVITKQDGGTVEIPLESFSYSYDTDALIEEIYAKINHNMWFSGLSGSQKYSFTDSPSYDSDLLKSQLSSADWGSTPNSDATLDLTESGYVITPEVQGDEMDYSKLESYIINAVNRGEFEINAVDSDCYIKPSVTSADLQDKCDTLNNVFAMQITYDFDYTTETLTGETLMNIVTVGDDGSITADPDKAMEYVEYLADKYDTYNTERNFHATLQGDIVIPTSSDAKYGWWIDQEQTCDELVSMLEAGETVESVDPIYYETGGYVFTGREEARSADDDIGNTYIEIDLTDQHFWYYVDGELVRECYIVSGQTTSEARTTLPGVYKVWYKDENYRMQGTNEDGDEWDVTCNYWTRVAIVGIGLHDSTWRGTAFGGSIYKYNGSHGCINMSLADAKFVHDEVPMGTPVVMYY